MPHINTVEIANPQIAQGSRGNNTFDATVHAKIVFSSLEKEFGISYKVKIALYEIDDMMDVYSAFPNNPQLYLQRTSRGDKDDFLGFSDAKSIQAQDDSADISHRFTVQTSFEADQRMELRALVVCVPETATAMKWSSTERVQIIAG